MKETSGTVVCNGILGAKLKILFVVIEVLLPTYFVQKGLILKRNHDRLLRSYDVERAMEPTKAVVS